MNAALGSLTRRRAIRQIGLTGAALGAVTAVKQASAQDSDAIARHPIVGVWRVTADPPGPSLGFAAYHADGIMSFATPTPSVDPAAAAALAFEVPAYGVWEATGERTAAMTGVHLESDENGAFVGTLTFYATVEVDDTGDAYELQTQFEIADPTGAVTFAASATTHATRLRVQSAPMPPETATPSS